MIIVIDSVIVLRVACPVNPKDGLHSRKDLAGIRFALDEAKNQCRMPSSADASSESKRDTHVKQQRITLTNTHIVFQPAA